MAGTPKKMAKAVTKLEAQHADLREEILSLIPQRCCPDSPEYLKCGHPKDAIGQAWEKVHETIRAADNALEWLGDLLREKAGIEWSDVFGSKPTQNVAAPVPDREHISHARNDGAEPAKANHKSLG